MTDREVYDLALEMGWVVDRVSLYDEEGVEGWLWTSPDGVEYAEIGDWNLDPTIPENVFALMTKNS